MQCIFQFFKGLGLVVAGTAIIFVGWSAGIAWLGFCFGTVVVGLLMLFLCPTILLLPFSLSTTPGLALITVGVATMFTKDI